MKPSLPNWLNLRLSGCSPEAHAVLEMLRANGAHDEDTAMTDRRLSHLTHVLERDIVILAGELLKAGALVVACGRGRYFIAPGEDLAPAREYADSLHSRAKDIHVRAGDASKAIELYERCARPEDSTGQGNLDFALPGGTPPQCMEALIR